MAQLGCIIEMQFKFAQTWRKTNCQETAIYRATISGMDIPVEKYLLHAIKFKPEEIRLRDSFSAWLPEDIIDCHAHCNRPEDVSNVPEKALKHMLSTFPYYSLEDSAWIRDTFFHPGKHIRTLRFAKTFSGINHRTANAYLLQESPSEDRVALFGLPEDAEYTISMLDHPRVSALKMYYSYIEPTAQKIYEVFKPEILARAQQLDKPIILHMPKTILGSIDDLEQVIADFPRLRIVIAHLGSTKFVVPGLKEAYLRLVPRENIFLDTALNPSGDVVRLALECFGRERILYGSDEPLHLIRSTAYNNPKKGQRIVTDYPYHWVDSEEHSEFGHLATKAIHAHWQALGAVRTAIETLPKAEQEDAKRQIFFTNARDFFRF